MLYRDADGGRETVSEQEEQQEFSQSGGSFLGTALQNKRLQTDRAVVGHKRKNQRTFSL